MKEDLTAKLEEVKDVYNASGSDVKKALEHIFGKEHFEFNYREIKSFEDACKHLGISKFVPINRVGFDIDVQAAKQSEAMYKIIVICKALCNGKYTDEDGDIWFPMYWLYNKKELEDMGEDERKRQGIQLLSACHASGAETAGVRFANAVYRGAYTVARYGFPLFANSNEMADYLDEQFRDLIYQCYGIKVKQENE